MNRLTRLIVVTAALCFFFGGITSVCRAGADFNGDWLTDWGLMNLAQKSYRVVGEYESHQNGQVVIGALKGFWIQPGEKGEFGFRLSSDGSSFTGRWRHGMSGEWGAWSGKKR
jgi:hypothetical protein